ncbi:MAG: hypothetical protein AAB495_04370, partial [Patescibacteria group bacterium]
MKWDFLQSGRYQVLFVILKITSYCALGALLLFGAFWAKNIPNVEKDLALLTSSFKKVFSENISLEKQSEVPLDDDDEVLPTGEELFAVKNSSQNDSSRPKSEEEAVTQKEKKVCVFDGEKKTEPTLRVNEINWMGSKENANEEWIELFNISSGSVRASRWSILGPDEKFHIVVEGGNISPGGYWVLRRGADYLGALPNSGVSLRLVDVDCFVHDEIVVGKSWPAGDNITKQTMERTEDGGSWYTSAKVGGTPGEKNSSQTVVLLPKKEEG